MAVHPFLRGLWPTLHIAHRGGAALAPENTVAAFRRAVDEFATDMIELDVHVTRDGEVVVAHDDTLDRCTDGEGRLAERSFAELLALDAGYRFTADGRTYPYRGVGLRIPRLADVLAEFGGRLNVELKPTGPGLERPLAEILRRAGALDRACVGSADDETAERIVAALPDACHFYPKHALVETHRAVHAGELPPDPAYRILDMPLYMGESRLLSGRLMEWARAAGRWINVWTVDEAAEMRRLIGEGVGGIMTDRPDVLRAVLAQTGGVDTPRGPVNN
jgi:glycerophosphoryl diester phosphodiesterase